ncbi:MAG TPA: Holliday junction resolvase [Epulopiscium sp.]|nr:Holliday junction resolvase [Candidatus Epulonipiscium sp.]
MSKYANKGKGLEDLVEHANKQYEVKGIALVQKISTPWTVIRKGKQIVSAFPSGQSTLDFRGTVDGGISISFDCKETAEEKGLPLANIQDHQIDYMRAALQMGELTFILVSIKPTGKYYKVLGGMVLHYWDTWQLNKYKRGFNFIPIDCMEEIIKGKGVALDYLVGLYK